MPTPPEPGVNDRVPDDDPPMEVLLAVKDLLDGSLDPELLRERLAGLLVARLCDWCSVDLLEEDGSIGPPAIACHDPVLAEIVRRLRERFLADGDPSRGFRGVIATGVAELHPVITDADLVAVARDEEHLRLLRVVGQHSAIVAPVSVRGRTFGAVTVVRGGARRFEEGDLALVRAIAARAALALDNARLYRAERAARLRAEQAAVRLRRLQDVILALSGASTPERVATLVLEHAVAALGAERGLVSLLSADRRTLDALAVRGGDLPEALRSISVDAPLAIASAFRRGAAEILETPAAYHERFPGGPAHELALLAVPLLASGEVCIGAFAVVLDEPRPISDDERALLDTLGRQGGQALERARLHEAERRARITAERANQAKDEFLSVVSHELRTPLNAILGWAGLLRGKAEPGSMIDKGVLVIERNARAQAKLIDDILDVSRVIAGKLELGLAPLDVEPILRATVEAARPTAEAKGVTMEMRVADPLAPVSGDAGRLRQVISSLLANAVKFTPAGGRVTASIELRAGELSITVTDTGSGISPEFLPHVFESFRQADASSVRSHGGLGLGLSLTRHLIELHHGRIVAESEGEGRGARFTVSLPCLPSPAVTALTPIGAGASRALTGMRVLVVDDEPDALEMIAAVLSERGAEVSAAPSAAAAIEQIDRSRPHVLLSDIGMPITDGYALLARVRALPGASAHVPAVALTAFARAADAARAAEAGFAAHLAKPVDPEVLTSVLLSVAGKISRVA